MDESQSIEPALAFVLDLAERAAFGDARACAAVQEGRAIIASLKEAGAEARRTRVRGDAWLVFTRGRGDGHEWKLWTIEFEGVSWADKAFKRYCRRDDVYVGLLAPDGSVRAFRG